MGTEGDSGVSGGGVPISWVRIMGVAGAPDLDLEVGPMTALIGPRGSGKSQLLTALSWLLGGPDAPVLRTGSAELSVTVRTGAGASPSGAPGELRRALGTRGETLAAPKPDDLPPSSFLRVRDRLGKPSSSSSGAMAERIAGMMPAHASDAAGADALVAAMDWYAKEGGAGQVLLIEEPELLLTPQTQRYLYGLLRRFAERGNQVLYSTWSPSFVDAAHHDEIVRLDLRQGGSVARRTDPGTLSDPERVRIQAEFDHERSEMFFARKVVLVEGQTERLSLPFMFRAMGHDPDAEGIAIVEMGGKGNLSLAARILVQLAIPFVVMFDADHGPASAVLDTEIRQAAAGAPTIRLEPDFEGAAGISSHDDKVLHAFDRFANAEPEAIPAPFAELVRATVALP